MAFWLALVLGAVERVDRSRTASNVPVPTQNISLLQGCGSTRAEQFWAGRALTGVLRDETTEAGKSISQADGSQLPGCARWDGGVPRQNPTLMCPVQLR